MVYKEIGVYLFIYLLRGLCYRVRVLARQTERDRQKARNHLPRGVATLQSLLLHSPLGILGTHTHVPLVSFKSPDQELEPQSTTWESSDITILPSAGPILFGFYCFVLFFCLFL